jgi:hypothetical protein
MRAGSCRRALEPGWSMTEAEIAEMSVAGAAVARHARRLRPALSPADQAVEQGRLADVRPTHDRDGEGMA